VPFKPHLWIICIWIFLNLTATCAQAGHQQRLQSVKNQIQQLKQRIYHKRSQKNTLSQKLQKNESRIGHIAAHIERIKYQQRKQHHRLTQLKNQRQKLKQRMSQQRSILKRALRQAYMINRQNELKIILNASNPNQIQRLLTEYQYVTQAQTSALNKLGQHINDLNDTQQDIQNTLSRLQKLKNRKRKQKLQLQKLKRKRKRVVSQINHDLQHQQQRLKQLKHDRQHLHQLVNNIPHKRTKTTPFPGLKGQLPWPVKGRVVQHYGSQLANSQFKSHGMVLKAPHKQPVRAVADGEVVFANWLSGYGLVLIVEHSDGYMSIYAHNYTLLKDLGDHVKQHDKIARVGQSGGYHNPRLYFALRHNGQPINPRPWLTNQR